MISFFKLIEIEFLINFRIDSIFELYIEFKCFSNFFQSALSTLYASFIKLSTVSIFLQIIKNSIISWSDSVKTFSLIDQFVILLIIWRVAKVKSIIDVDVRFWSFFILHCFEKMISFEMFINSHWFLVNQSINEFARIEKKILKFHHAWYALKSSQIIEFADNSIFVNIRSMIYSFDVESWFFSLYILIIMQLSISMFVMCKIWKSELFENSNLNVIFNVDFWNKNHNFEFFVLINHFNWNIRHYLIICEIKNDNFVFFNLWFLHESYISFLIKSIFQTILEKAPPVRKSPVPDRSSSEKSSEELAQLRSVENSQNYQIWSRIDRVIKTFLFISLSYNARRKRGQNCKQTSKIISISHIWLKKSQKNSSYIKHQSTNQLHQSVLHQIDLFITIQRKHQIFEVFQHLR